jgi:mannose-6-phosphate isomerase class I
MIWRETTQALLPERMAAASTGRDSYNRYPVHPLGNGKINNGYQSLAKWMAAQQTVLIDGYAGVFWSIVQTRLEAEFEQMGIRVKWHFMVSLMKDAYSIEEMVRPFTGAADDVWGTCTTLQLQDFFEQPPATAFSFNEPFDLHIVLGTGAALASDTAPLVYLELPKNELQYRMRAGTATNFGDMAPSGTTAMYKRFYFVDRLVLNNYKSMLLPRIHILADTQWPESIAWAFHRDILQGIREMTQSVFRVRPWYEAGAWGGQWLKQHIEGINRQEVNYAWSFELIVPENGVILESDGWLMEIPFEWMMYAASDAILGKHAPVFGYEFPVRFDFLDTFDGGNLSIQCHPTLTYIRKVFGETFTQDETYYILDCKEDATVYLGFREGTDPATFRTKLENSRDLGLPVAVTDFVQQHPAGKHDLFLIPNGTVHSAGAGNLVLEISATPYIFTFKMYDWLRPGLDGKPRAINIEHAFHNLDFSRQGAAVKASLISCPVTIDQGKDWQVIHLPTHTAHFYDVHRLEFTGSMEISTDNSCLVMMVVEGTEVEVITANGHRVVFRYAETFVIPANAVLCRLDSRGAPVKVIKAFLKSAHPVFDIIAPQASV